MDVAERRPVELSDTLTPLSRRGDDGVLTELARAKINLTLSIVGRRADGYHLLESLVGFAGSVFDDVAFIPGERLSLTVDGPCASDAGAGHDNLVLKAARALEARWPDLALGAFRLSKRIPVAAGLGGGSADAAAALRLLARHNRLSLDDSRLRDAALAVGADVLVCIDSAARIMRGIGDELDPPTVLRALPALLVNPRFPCPTADVFRAFSAERSLPGSSQRHQHLVGAADLGWISAHANDLESAAIRVAPMISDVLAALRAAGGCRIARMSGSGATCFGLFDDDDSARRAEDALRGARPDWWIAATTIQ